MRSKSMKASILALLLAGWGVDNTNAGTVLRYFYDNIPGTTVASLTTATNAAGQLIFPSGPNADGSPLQTELISEFFEGVQPPVQPGPNNYGSMMEGYLLPPVTGNYTFWVSSDDSSELWISTNNAPEGKQKVAAVDGATGFRAFDANASQKSASISLVRGQSYYIQVIQKEGGGDDHVSVAWQIPDGSDRSVLSMQYVQGSPIAYWADPSFLTEPESVTVVENNTATFASDVNATPPIAYQWYKGITPNPTAKMEGETLSYLTIPAKLSDNNTYYRLMVSAKSGLVMSKVVKLTVEPDVVAPTVTSATSSMFNPTKVNLTFSEAVNMATATDPANYAIDNSAMIYGIVAGDAPNKVVLYTSELTLGASYKLTVTGVKDFATTPNVSNVQTTIVVPTAITYKVYDGIGGTSTNDILNSTAYKTGDFSRVFYVDKMEGRTDFADTYIGQLQAYLIPPTTANYKFYIAGDDGCLLYLSTDENPANKTVIAGHNSWTGSRSYNSLPEQQSAFISLEAGKKYYIEAVLKEGGGGDNLSVAWQKEGDAAPANGSEPIPGSVLAYYGSLGAVSVIQNPANVTVGERFSATFSIPVGGVVGTPNYSYQWYRDGQIIPGATGRSYTIDKVTLADNNAAFTVLVNNEFSMAVSGNARLTVVADTVAPVASPIAFFTNAVHILYSEPVDMATALDPANYTLKSPSGAAVAISSVVSNSPTTVVLVTPTLTFDGAYTLAISGVKDLSAAGNTVDYPTATLRPFNAVVANINNSQPFSVNGDKLYMEAGGADIWGTSDQLLYAYRELNGNFDYKVRLPVLTTADSWTKAGLMARVTTAAGSRHVSNLATPQGGMNIITMDYRDATNGDSSDAPTVQIQAQYPNVWLRMQRVGSVFYCYYSTNGVDWVLHNQKDTGTAAAGAFGTKVLMGLALTSHNTSATAKASFEDWGKMPVVPILVSDDMEDATSIQSRTITFTAPDADGGPFSYVWQKKTSGGSWSVISGATGRTYSTPPLTLADNGAEYRAVYFNSTTNAFGPSAVVTVTADTTAPVIASAASLAGDNRMIVTFNELMDSASVIDPASYSVSGATVTGVTYRADSRMAVLQLSGALTGTATVGASGAKDYAGNPVAATVTSAVANMAATDVGTVDANGQFTDPIEKGYTFPTSAKDFEVQAGGSDIWNSADGMHFAYQLAEGNFDVRVRVESLRYVSDNWCKAGLMIRESLAGDSRSLNMVVCPTQGANQWEQNYRPDTGAGSTGWPNSSAVGPVTYPDAWVRIVREGDVFTALRSTNGADWEVRASMTMTFPTNKVVVGMAATAHNNTLGTNTVAKFRDYSLTAFARPSITSVVGSGTMDTVTVNFSKPMVMSSLTNLANYAVDNGLTINGITANAEGTKVFLATSQQIPGALYTVTVSNQMGRDAFSMPTASKAFSAWVFSQGAIKREMWNGIGNPLSNLKASPKYPNNPDSVDYLTSMDSPDLGKDNYSQKMSGWVKAPATGNYTFFIASDDDSELYLSTDDQAANKQLIAKVTGWASYHQYNNEANQKSAPIALEAGKYYYIEALMAEGGGGDNLSVAWAPVGETTLADGEASIAPENMYGFVNPDAAVLAITGQPVGATIEEGRSTSLNVSVYSSLSNTYFQWQKKAAGGANWANIKGANSATYNTGALGMADSGTAYRVVITIPGAVATSDPAVVTVIQDVVVPEVVGIASLNNATNLSIRFSEPLDPASATNLDNYIVYTSVVIPVTGASIRQDNTLVVLELSEALTNRVVVWVENVKDAAGNVVASGFTSSKSISLTAQDVGTAGNPVTAGATYSALPGEFEVVGGGADIWGTSDGMQFVYKKVTGDFDVKVRIASLQQQDYWTKAGLMVREDLDANSRNAFVVAIPTGGENAFQAGARATKGGDTAEIASRVRPVPYPNAWMRIARVGGDLKLYCGSNGTDWTLMTTVTPTTAFPASVYVGMAVTSHNNNAGATSSAMFADFSLTGTTGSLLSIGRQGSNIVLSWSAEGAEGMILETGSPEEGWAPLNLPVETDGERNSVAVPIDAAKRMFRLTQ